MKDTVRISALAGLVLLCASCATKTEITLPALDASKTLGAEALIVQPEYTPGFSAPDNVVRGAGEGAAKGMGIYLGGMLHSSPEGTMVGLLLAPIGLPVSAAVGASMARSDEEVDAAVFAFNRVSLDTRFMTSIGHRFIEVLEKAPETRWACVEVLSETVPEPCLGYSPAARITLRPVFRLVAEGMYNPKIHFSGEVVAIASVDGPGTGAAPEEVLKAKWVYREKLGKFFDLADNDAALLRGKLSDILDKFAARMADDLYLVPLESTVKRSELAGQSSLDHPDETVVRVE